MREGVEIGPATQLASLPSLFKLPGPGPTAAVMLYIYIYMYKKRKKKKTPPFAGG